MWTTVLVLALALNLEPNRLGIIGLLILRPHPIRQLLAFLCTSFVVSLAAGLLVLFVVHRGSLLKADSSSAIMQIGVGAVALLVAVFLFIRSAMRKPVEAVPAGATPATDSIQSTGLTLVDNFTSRMGRFARGDSPWLAIALGVGISLPSVDYVALLLIIAASGQPPQTQVAALLTFLTIANTVLLIPVLSYAFAKERTVAAIERLRTWVLARSLRDYAVLLTIAGLVMITVGLKRL